MIRVRQAAATPVCVLVCSAFVVLAGCVTTSSSLTASADRLEDNADVLARDARDDYSRAARDLADQAHDFRRAVNDRRADSDDVRDAFDDLSKDYHDLRDAVDRSDSDRAEDDLKPVTEAYLDIEREMERYGDRDRYASDDDRRDRY